MDLNNFIKMDLNIYRKVFLPYQFLKVFVYASMLFYDF